MRTISQTIKNDEILSVEQADKICSDLAILEKKGEWVAPEWAIELGKTYGVPSSNCMVIEVAWRATTKAYQSRTILAETKNELIQYERDELASMCHQLAHRLICIADELGSDIPNKKLMINSLGEIQSEGNMIDVKCSRIMTMIEYLS